MIHADRCGGPCGGQRSLGRGCDGGSAAPPRPDPAPQEPLTSCGGRRLLSCCCKAQRATPRVSHDHDVITGTTFEKRRSLVATNRITTQYGKRLFHFIRILTSSILVVLFIVIFINFFRKKYFHKNVQNAIPFHFLLFFIFIIQCFSNSFLFIFFTFFVYLVIFFIFKQYLFVVFMFPFC